MHLAAYCTLLAVISPQNECKWRFLYIKIHFAYMHRLTLFASKPTFARIVFSRSGWRLADKKSLKMLKFLLKSRQKNWWVDKVIWGRWAVDRVDEVTSSRANKVIHSAIFHHHQLTSWHANNAVNSYLSMGLHKPIKRTNIYEEKKIKLFKTRN